MQFKLFFLYLKSLIFKREHWLEMLYQKNPCNQVQNHNEGKKEETNVVEI